MINFIFEIILIYALYKTNQKKKIYYNNYKQCLRALTDNDPKLAEYLRNI